jgi:2-polyprenyl-3-methyl-5-hydroxy-6-metoxy-1,4-benzoquinol methylase
MKCVLCGNTHFSGIHNLGKCTVCGLVQVVPMRSEKEIRKLYHEDMEHFKPYIAQIPVHRKYFKKKIQDIKKIILPSNLLDIGCAMGILLEEARRVGVRATGIDISRDAVIYCRKKKLDVLEGTLSSIGGKLHNNSFDVVTAFEIIEHERNPLEMMRRVHTLLKNDGIAVLTTPNHDSFWRKIMGKWWVGYRHSEHVTFWDPTTLRELFQRAGFKNSTIRRDSPRPFPLSFVFTRGSDYVSWASGILKPIGKYLDRLNLKNPVNPWDDLIVIGKK